MAKLGEVKIKNQSGEVIEPVSEMGLVAMLLERITRMLKPLTITTGAGSNRLAVDSYAISGTITTVTTVTTTASLTNQVALGNVTAFTLQQAMLRNAFANGISANLTFS